MEIVLIVCDLICYYEVFCGLFKGYVQVCVLNGVLFELEVGKIFVVVGEFGCGKLILVCVLILIEEFIFGLLKIVGQEVKGVSKDQCWQLCCDVQMVFQNFYVLFNL